MARNRVKKTNLELGENIDQERLFGKNKEHLKAIEDKTGVKINCENLTVTIHNSDYKRCQSAKKIIEQMAELCANGRSVTPQKCEQIITDVMENGGNKGKALRHAFNGVSLTLKNAEIKARNESQSNYMQGILDTGITFGIGPAGTGKTFLAVAAAVDAFERGEVKKIILCRPAVEAGERLGFLPGDQKDKVDPYFKPIYDALHDTLGPARMKQLVDNGTIEIAPLAFMRGRTLKDAFIILDEAQNTTKEQMKMFLTRLGDNSKMVITGDHTQIDLPDGQTTSGLVQAIKAMKGIEGIYIHEFETGDVVRNEMVGKMLEGYERLEREENAPNNDNNAEPSPSLDR